MSLRMPSTSFPTAGRAARASVCRAGSVRSPAFISGGRVHDARLGCSLRSRRGSKQVVRMGLFGLGVPELVVIGAVAALLFGPSKLPELGKGLGKTVKSFQEAAKEFETELKTEVEGGEAPVEGAKKTEEVSEKKECECPVFSSSPTAKN